MVAICPTCQTRNRSVAKFCMKCVTSLQATFADGDNGGDNEEPPFDETSYFHEERTIKLGTLRSTLASRTHVAPVRSSYTEHALPNGTFIEGFRITRAIGEGGFGIVYLAWDAALERQVAIKEYMPSSLAVRAKPSLGVSIRSEEHRGTFEAGLRSFVNEARLLARFDHPALVKVFRFWESHRTAYMAMPYYEGPTLKASLAAMSGPPSEAQLRAWLDPLLDALTAIHREQCYHRDISPDNILLTTAGPLLLDFGAARRVISDMTQALTAVLKPGFAPIEQYGGDMKQGPWTDLYALAGVVHYALTGKPPLASVVRVVNDTLTPLSVSHAGKCSEAFLRAIDAALAVRPEARPQDVSQFRQMLDSELSADTATVPTPLAAPDTSRDPGLRNTEFPSTMLQSIPGKSRPEAAAAIAGPRRRSSHAMFALATAAMLAVLGATGWWMKTSQEHVQDAASLTAPETGAASTATEVPAQAIGVPALLPKLGTASTRAADPPPLVVVPAASASAPVPAPTVATVPNPAPDRARLVRAAGGMAPPQVARTKPAAVVPVALAAERPLRSEAEAAPVQRKEVARPSRCAAIVEKSSLEPLSPEDIEFLRKDCK